MSSDGAPGVVYRPSKKERSEQRGLRIVQVMCAAASVVGLVVMLWAGFAAHGPVGEVLLWALVVAVLCALAAWPLAALVAAVVSNARDQE